MSPTFVEFWRELVVVVVVVVGRWNSNLDYTHSPISPHRHQTNLALPLLKIRGVPHYLSLSLWKYLTSKLSSRASSWSRLLSVSDDGEPRGASRSPGSSRWRGAVVVVVGGAPPPSDINLMILSDFDCWSFTFLALSCCSSFSLCESKTMINNPGK